MTARLFDRCRRLLARAVPKVEFVTVVSVALALTACTFDAPIREDYSYRLTVVVSGTYDEPPTVERLGFGSLVETAPGVFVFEDTPDYGIDPYAVEIHVQQTGGLATDEFFSVTVRYEELGMIPVGSRTLYAARRDYGDGINPEIRKIISVPQ
jgi:hypothetical protein